VSPGEERLPKSARVTRRSEFLSLSKDGNKVHTSHFIVLWKANDRGESRLGITVTTRVGGSVVRNRIKRLIREFFRRRRREFPDFRDIVVIAKKGSEKISLGDVAVELEGTLQSGRSRRK
jgi:ribonuclease P protein component